MFFSPFAPLFIFLFFYISHLLLSTLLQFFPCLLHPNASPPGWLTVCCVYLGLQGDVGLPGPSGTPGDGSLRSEQTLTIYKGDKVTQQGKARSRWCSAFTTHTHTQIHTHRRGDVPLKSGEKKVSDPAGSRLFFGVKIKRKRSSDGSKLYSSGGEDGWAQTSVELKEEETWRRVQGASVEYLLPCTGVCLNIFYKQSCSRGKNNVTNS